MSSPRVRKVADRIQVIVAEMLERRIKDPRLGFVTVTDVRVTETDGDITIEGAVDARGAYLLSASAVKKAMLIACESPST